MFLMPSMHNHQNDNQSAYTYHTLWYWTYWPN